MRLMREGDHAFFFKFYRMTPGVFDLLLSSVKNDLTRQYAVREPLEPGERLAIALRLAKVHLPITLAACVFRLLRVKDQGSWLPDA